MVTSCLSFVLILFVFHCSAGPMVWSSQEEDHLSSHVLPRGDGGTEVLTVVPVTPKASATTKSHSESASETEAASHDSHSHSQSASTTEASHVSHVSQSQPQFLSTVTICTCGNASPHSHAAVTTDGKGNTHTLSTFNTTKTVHASGSSPTTNATNSHQTAGTVVSLSSAGNPSKTTKQEPSDSGGCGLITPAADANKVRSPEHTHTPTTYPIWVVINPVPPLSLTETITLYGGVNPLVPHLTDRPTVTTTLGDPGNGNVARTPIEARTPVAEGALRVAAKESPILEAIEPLPSTTLTHTLYRGADPFQPHQTNRPTVTTTIGVPPADPPADTNKQPPASVPPTPGTPPPAPPAPTTTPPPQPELARPKQAPGTSLNYDTVLDFPHFHPPPLTTTLKTQIQPVESPKPTTTPEETPSDLPEKITKFILPYPRLSWMNYGQPSPFKAHHTNRPTTTTILGTRWTDLADLPPATVLPPPSGPTTTPPPPEPTTTTETINPMLTTVTYWPYFPPW